MCESVNPSTENKYNAEVKGMLQWATSFQDKRLITTRNLRCSLTEQRYCKCKLLCWKLFSFIWNQTENSFLKSTVYLFNDVICEMVCRELVIYCLFFAPHVQVMQVWTASFDDTYASGSLPRYTVLWKYCFLKVTANKYDRLHTTTYHNAQCT
jgi:hypothetical protein